MEVFKPIENYEGLYAISNMGNVKSFISNKILKACTDNQGYSIVTLCKDKVHRTKTIHRLVAIAFIPNLELKKQVNHKDGIKQNNNVNNLEWATSKENILHALQKGLFVPNFKKIAFDKRKKVLQINPNTYEVVEIYISSHDAAKKTGFNRGNISSACRNETNKVGNFLWKYDN